MMVEESLIGRAFATSTPAVWCLLFSTCRIRSRGLRSGSAGILNFFFFWTLSHLFRSPVSPESRSSLVPLHFLPLKWYHLLSEVDNISRCNLTSVLWVIQPAFPMMYSAFNLNKQGDNIQPWSIPFPVLNQPAIPLFHVLFYCCFLTCMQISQEAAKLVFKTNSL